MNFHTANKRRLILSCFILFFFWVITRNPITNPKPKPFAGYWSIQLMQQPLIFGLAGHNFLVLKDSNQKTISELHGLATDPITRSWKYVGMDKDDLLQVWEFSSDEYLSSKNFPGVVLSEGNQEEMEQKFQKARNCTPAINAKNLHYPPFGIRIMGETENSNSVAYTLMLCMGIDESKHIGLFTPGSNKNLMLEDAESLVK